MEILEIAGICVAAALLLLLAVFIRRRLLKLSGGTIRLQIRISTVVPGRGWSTAIGQFAGGEFRIYRMFSFAFRPKRVLDRGALTIEERRRPQGPERLTIPGHWIVLRLATATDQLEIAMAESTVTGFLSWLEAAPPGLPGSISRPVSRPRTIEQ
jgi:hypothetical protein